MNGQNYSDWEKEQEKLKGGMSFGEAVKAGQTKAGKRFVSSTTEVDKAKTKKWSDKFGGADGLSKTSDVFAKLAQYTPGSVHRGVDYNQNIASAAGETSDPYTVVQDGYSGGIKTGEGPQTTLLRNTETEPKKKKKNKYSHYGTA
tara:strand:+ start:175 stop:609 length:435 start_codon:yes stop_codon:yes gene_type:complete